MKEWIHLLEHLKNFLDFNDWKESVVVKLGTIITTDISVGKRFADYYNNGLIDVGNCELKLLNVQ